MAEKLKIIPLGGLDEIGKNITVLEYGRDMIVVDCGVGFPDEDMYGVDLVIPDFSYLVQNAKKLRGMFIQYANILCQWVANLFMVSDTSDSKFYMIRHRKKDRTVYLSKFPLRLI